MSYFPMGKSKPHESGSKIKLRCSKCGHEWNYAGISAYKATCSRCGKTCNLRRCQVKEVPKNEFAEVIKSFNMNFENWSIAIGNSSEETKAEGAKLFRRLMEECENGS